MKFWLIWSVGFFPTMALLGAAAVFLKFEMYTGAIVSAFSSAGYFFVFIFVAKSWDTYRVNAFLKKHDVKLKYRHDNHLGIDVEKSLVFIKTDEMRLFSRSDIRMVEAKSIFETKSTAFKVTAVDKNCHLVIHTRSLDRPTHAVGFPSKALMEDWNSRLGVFCNLS